MPLGREREGGGVSMGPCRPEDSVSALSVTPSQWRVFEQVSGTV